MHGWGRRQAQGTNLGGGNFLYYPGNLDEVFITTAPLSLAQHQDLYALEDQRVTQASQIAPYGTWRSPITADLITGRRVSRVESPY